MRINPSIANQMYLNYSENSDSSSSSTSSVLPSGTYSKLAAAKYIKEGDKDGDGCLSSDEVTLSAEAYAMLDADSDGKVSKAEMEESLSGMDNEIYEYYKTGGEKTHTEDVTSSVLTASNSGSTTAYSSLAAKRFMEANDADEDGVLTLDESDLSASVFSKVDADGDGEATMAELKTVLASKNSTIQKYYKNGGTSSLADLTSTLLAKI